ncbi:MAG: GumC family protein, partial [bacterium]
MEIRHYLEILRRRVWIIALLTVITVGGVVYQLASVTPKYEAEVSALVTPRVTAPTAFEDPGPSAFPGAYRETVLENIALLIQSREVLQRAADKVGGLSAEALRQRVEVTDIRGSDFLLIKGRHDLPERAALIANTVAQELVSFYQEVNSTEARQSQQFVLAELRGSQERLRAAELALLVFKARGGATSLTGQSASMSQRLLTTQSTYEGATLEDRVAQSRVQAIQRRLRSQEDPRLASVSIATNPIVAQLRSQLTTLELELASLRQVNTDEHPKVKELVGRVADVRQRLKTEGLKVVKDESLGVSPIREQLVREMVTAEIEGVVARARAAGILRQLGGMQTELKGIPKNELTLARLERDVKLAEEIYIRLSTLHREAVIRENKAGSSGQAAIVLVDNAKIPEQPVSNQLPLKAGFAGLVGMVVGAALALLVDSMDDRIRSSRQAEGAYG